MTDSCSESEFLCSLFHRLREAGVIYAVLRNSESWPYSSGGSDIDIYIAPEFRATAIRVLDEVMLLSGASRLGQLDNDTFFELCIIGNNKGQYWGGRVEFYYGVFFKRTIILVEANQLANEIVGHNGINILKQDIRYALGFIKEILVHDSFREDKLQYEGSASRLITDDSARFSRVFSNLGAKASLLLKDVIDSNGLPCRKNRIGRFRHYVLFRRNISSLFCMRVKKGVMSFHV